jgi:hypothetical protein
MNVYALTRIALGALFLFTGVLGTAHASGSIVSSTQKEAGMTTVTKQVKGDAAAAQSTAVGDYNASNK